MQKPDMIQFMLDVQEEFTRFRKFDETGKLQITVKYRDGVPHLAEMDSRQCRVFCAPTVKGHVSPSVDLNELVNEFLSGNDRAHGRVYLSYSFFQGNLVDRTLGKVQNSRVVTVD